jgi:hypothetical protein
VKSLKERKRERESERASERESERARAKHAFGHETRHTHQKPALHCRHLVRVSSDSEPAGQIEGIQLVHRSRFCLTHSQATSRATTSSEI